MKTEPMVSICLPTYNRAEYLPEAIDSILAQTYKNWELIVADDGSTDSTPELMAYYTGLDRRIKYVALPKNGGIAKARNKALGEATGSFLAVMDSDDICHKDRLRLAVRELQKTGADFFYSAYARADMKGQVRDMIFTTKKITADEIRFNLGVIPHVTIVAKRHCFEQYPYRNYLTTNDDLALCIDWYKAGFTYCSSRKPTVMVRYHDQSVSATKDKEVKAFTKELLKELEGVA